MWKQLNKRTNDEKKGEAPVCPFCMNIFGRNEEQGLPKEETVVYEDEFIYVMPDICPLTVGHLLIISKTHCQGYANTIASALHAVERFLIYYEKQIGFRNYTIFEHGALIDHHGGASIDHAHIHIIPHELNMNVILDPMFHDSIPCELKELPQFSLENQPYLYYRIGNDKTGYAYPVGKVKSQILRDVANQLLKRKQEYNWKKAYWKADSHVDFLKTLAWWRSLSYPITFKWKKKLILVKYGLTTYWDIIYETNRFLIGEIDLVVEILKKELECADQNSYRLVLVPIKHQYKLPNYIVYDKEDLNGIYTFLNSGKGYQEIWYFIESFHKSIIISGRLSYNWLGHDILEYIELVCGDTPREIEFFFKNADMEYMRVSKYVGMSTYYIEDIRVGTTFRSENEWRQAFRRFIRQLDIYDNGLIQFREMIRKYNIQSASLDFRIVDNRLMFIDWDTSNDSIIINNE